MNFERIERRASCNLAWLENRGFRKPENLVAAKNKEIIQKRARPDLIQKVELLSIEDDTTAGYRDIYATSAVVDGKTGRILAISDDAENAEALHSSAEAVPVEIVVNRDFYKDEPEVGAIHFELLIPDELMTESGDIREGIFTDEALDNLRESFELLQSSTVYYEG